ncbi:MAG: hypothetical protein MAG551_00371 [Candidatus Scalindua arabica]|uniref:Uncharacterized protein n=1 Tax=Candidatus Scalindua arabica TaxID=1127984 RepID=A0A941VZB4_9BACT|nr:hypothetical protein [Candidatus Scalindua arabica]
MARLVLRDLINATVGCEDLAVEVSNTKQKSPQNAFSQRQSTMDNLTTIFKVLRQKLNVDIEVHIVPCH